MGSAMLRGWLTTKAFSKIHVVEPVPSSELRRLSRQGDIALSRNIQTGAKEKFSLAVIALKPQILREEGELLRKIGETATLVLSIAAGIKVKPLAHALGSEARMVRAMPNTPGAIGHGITALYTRDKLSKRERALVESATTALGETLWVDHERLMDAVTAVSGSGPAYVFLFAEALAAAACERGLDAVTADKLARATIAGAGALLEQDKRSAAVLRQEVTSPGGTTEAALKILMGKDGLRPLVRRAVRDAARRSRELGR
jgi:pyrroline-5-carboxylate reductase